MANLKKQPEAIAKLKGTYQPCRYPDSIENKGITYLTTVPDPPELLDSNGAKYWNNILKTAIGITGLIAVQDIYLFEELCYTYQIMTAAKQEMAIEGNTTINEMTAQRTKSIAYNIYMEQKAEFSRLCREFGFSPSSRASLKIQAVGFKEEEPEPELNL